MGPKVLVLRPAILLMGGIPAAFMWGAELKPTGDDVNQLDNFMQNSRGVSRLLWSSCEHMHILMLIICKKKLL